MHANPEGFEQRPVPVRPLDEEQARLIDLLRAAGGRAVSFEELRARGIDNPAVLCYELEIAGLPITHVDRPRAGVAPVPVGVRLEEPWLTGPGSVPRPRRLDGFLAWCGPAWARTRSTVLAGARGFALHARRAGAWLAGNAAWLAGAAASLLAAVAAIFASTASSWLEGRKQRSRARARASRSRQAEAARVGTPTMAHVADASRVGPGTDRAGGARPWGPSSAPAQGRERRGQVGTLAADAWLGSVALAAGELAGRLGKGIGSQREHLDAAVRATRARRRAPDVSDSRRTAAWILAAALAALAVTGVAIALSTGSGGVPAKVAGRHHLPSPKGSTNSAQLSSRSAARARHHPSEANSPSASGAGASGSASATARSARNEGSRDAAQLQAEGHRLLLEGRYAAAAADLRAAMNATGDSTGGCTEPATPGCLTYASARSELGRALQLERHPGTAVPIVGERLRIDNQHPQVPSGLNTPRHQPHAAPPSPGVSRPAPESHEGNETKTPSRQPSAGSKPQSGSTSHQPGEPASTHPQGPTATGETGTGAGATGGNHNSPSANEGAAGGTTG